MCLLRQHRRRQLIERIRRYLGSDNVEDDIDGSESEMGRREQEPEFTAAELGLRYPILQVAARRDLLHIRLKVDKIQIIDFYSTLIHFILLEQSEGANNSGLYRLEVFFLKPYRFKVRHIERLILSVATNHDPRWVSYKYREEEPVLMYFPTIFAMWIVDNLFAELRLPDPGPARPGQPRNSGYTDYYGRRWSMAQLNSVLKVYSTLFHIILRYSTLTYLT